MRQSLEGWGGRNVADGERRGGEARRFASVVSGGDAAGLGEGVCSRGLGSGSGSDSVSSASVSESLEAF